MDDEAWLRAALADAWRGDRRLLRELELVLLPDPPAYSRGDRLQCRICGGTESLTLIGRHRDSCICRRCLLPCVELERNANDPRPAEAMLLAELSRACRHAGREVDWRIAEGGRATRCIECNTKQDVRRLKPGRSGMCGRCMRFALFQATCPCCGHLAQVARGAQGFCPICGFEDTEFQWETDWEAHESTDTFRQARRNYLEGRGIQRSPSDREPRIRTFELRDGAVVETERLLQFEADIGFHTAP